MAKKNNVSRLPTSNRTRRGLVMIALASGTIALKITPSAVASLDYWQTAAGGSWNVAGNWSPVKVPTAGDDVFFTYQDTMAGTPRVVTYDSSVTPVLLDSLTVADSPGPSTAPFNFNVLSQTSGVLEVLNENIYSGGVYNLSGGNNNISTSLVLAPTTNGIGNSYYNLIGGALNVNASSGAVTEIIGQAVGTGIFTQTSGTNTLGNSTASNGLLELASGSGSAGTYNLTGSNLNVSGNAYVGGSNTASGGVGVFNISGSGVATISGQLTIWNTSGTAVNLASGGTLSVGSLNTTSGSASKFLNNWTGGTLNITGSTGLTIGTGGPLGNTLSLPAGKTLGVTNMLTLGTSGSVTLSGGMLSAGTLSTASASQLSWTSGTLNLSNSSLAIGSGSTTTTVAAEAWGYNNDGQLGNNSTTSSSVPVAVASANGFTNTGVTAIAAGGYHSLAVQGGSVYAWGGNYYGQLGNNSFTNSSVPVAVASFNGFTNTGVTAIAAGGYHSLAVQGGSVYAWGYNGYGQLGNNSTTNSSVPVAVNSSNGFTNTGVTAIAAGGFHSLAVQGGSVYAWGYNGNGQLGNNSFTNSSVPVAVNSSNGFTNTGVTAIAAGYEHSLAVQGGSVYAWGDNNAGQLGNNSFTNSSVPVAVNSSNGFTNTGVTAIAAGGFHSLAVQGGSVYAWGYNYYGQLGNNSTTNSSVPVHVDAADLTNIVAVSAGEDSSYALSANGSLWVWGDNTDGELGLGSTTTDYPTPQHLLPPSGYVFTGVASGEGSEHAVALLANIGSPLGSSLTLNAGQTLNITGSGQSLNLTGTLNVSGGGLSVPTINQTAGNFTNAGTLTLAATGANATVYNLNGGTLTTGALAVNTGGTFNWTSGTLNVTSSNGLTIGTGGPLGNTLSLPAGKSLGVTNMLTLGTTGSVTLSGGMLSAGTLSTASASQLSWTSGTLNLSNSSLAIGSGSTTTTVAAEAWGSNNDGQLGNNSTTNSSVPLAVASANGFTNSGVTAIAAGANHSLAVQGGSVYAWGYNNNGQLGNNSTTNSSVPVAVASANGFTNTGVTAIAAGGYHSLAVQGGSVYAWGYNGFGQLGNNSTFSSSVPVAVASTTGFTNTGVTAIAAGIDHSLAVQGGSVYAWGYNNIGQLGNNSTTNSSVPVAVASANGFTNTGVTAIAAGLYHSLAVQGGSVYAWGDNGNGQLGNNSFTNSSVPVAVNSSNGFTNTGVTAIAAGLYHSLAVQGGSVYAWGDNNAGQLGNNSTTNSSVPVHVDAADLTNIVAVSAGEYSSYALSANGSLWVWGDNAYGELGLGSTTDYPTPQHLLPPSGYVFTGVASGEDSYHAVALLANIGSPLGSSLTLNAGQTLNITGSGQSLNLTGTLNVSGGGLSVPTINQTAGNFTNAGTLTLAAAGSGGNATVYNLNGGTLTTGALAVNTGGTFNWTAGTLSITGTNGLAVGSGGPLGSALNVSTGQTLAVTNALTLSGGTLNISGGTVSAGSVVMSTSSILDLVLGDAPTVSGSVSLAGTLNLSGTAGTLPETVLTYGSYTGTFGTVNGVPANDKLVYNMSGIQLVVSGPPTFNWKAGTGNWSSTASWVGGVVPTGSTAVVNIDNGVTATNSVATLDQNASIGTLTVDTGDTLNINAGNTLVVNTLATVNGSMTNYGTLNLAGGTLNVPGGFGNSGLLLASGTISGSGYLSIGGNFNLSGNLALTNSAQFSLYSGNTTTLAGYQLQLNGSGSVVSQGTFNLSGGSITGGANGSNFTNYNILNGPGAINVVFGNNGTVTSGSGLSLNTVYNSGTLTLGGTYNISGVIYNYATAIIGGTPKWTAANPTFSNQGGTATFNSDSGSITPPNVIVNFGNVVLATTQHLASLTIASGTTTQVTGGGSGLRSMLFTPTLSVAGTLDLTNNDLDIQGGGATSLTSVIALIKQGYNNGTWTGGGITSTLAASNSAHLTALGVILNNQSGRAIYTASHPLDGFTPTAANDVLVKYTYYGDANLDGKVDGSDYSLIDSAYLADRANPAAMTGWFNGDFNYDGVIDGSDYTLIDNAFNTQGALLAASIASPAAVATDQIVAAPAATTAVPEPASLALLTITTTGMLSRRRNKQ